MVSQEFQAPSLPGLKECRRFEQETLEQLDQQKHLLLQLPVQELRQDLAAKKKSQDLRIEQRKKKHAMQKQRRDELRLSLGNSEADQTKKNQLDAESFDDSRDLRALKKNARRLLLSAQDKLREIEGQAKLIKHRRRVLAGELQDKLLEEYLFFRRKRLRDQASCLPPLDIVYQDEHLMVVDKPAGLLSVPGRTSAQQDSISSRFGLHFPQASGPCAVHRLDQATSGLMILALNSAAHREMSILFQRRQVQKSYLAVVWGTPERKSGIIDLAIRADFEDRPRQVLDPEAGKSSQTEYSVISSDGESSLVELMPLTGRTHQLRVHCALGLRHAIKGDRLYGRDDGASRLHLHASKISFRHPMTREVIDLYSPCPF